MDTDLQLRILKILKSSPSGLQMEGLAEKLGLTRHTVAKYLEILRAEGRIHYHKIGRSKLWKDIFTTTNIRLLTMDDLDSGVLFPFLQDLYSFISRVINDNYFSAICSF